jgi:gas vesicle protein
MAQKNNGGEFFAGLVVGGLIGAALALLLAPQSGEESRAQIREKGLDWQYMANETLADSRAKADAVLANTQAKAKEALSHLPEQAKEKATELQEKGKAVLENQTDKLKEQADKLKDAATKAAQRSTNNSTNNA